MIIIKEFTNESIDSLAYAINQNYILFKLMKKNLLAIAIALVGAGSISAQESVTLSTFAGTPLAKYHQKTLNVNASRQMFKGWNTISLPFSLSQEELEAAFGADCRLEKLVGVESNAGDVTLNFKDCKSEGIVANTPYILYFAGENANVKIKGNAKLVTDSDASVSFTAQGSGVKVTMSCAKTKTPAQGLYGIRAVDNEEATFVNVDDINTGFYATRCYISMSNGNTATLLTNHIDDSETTSITSVVKKNETADVYSISGSKVASKLSSVEISNLQPGIYVVKNKKVLVK